MKNIRFRKGSWVILPALIFAWFYPTPYSVKADALGEWTYSQSQNCGGYIEVVNNAITLHGPDNQLAPQGSFCGGAHWVKIETIIPANLETLNFNWAYQTNDGWVYDPPQYGINGNYTLITQNNNSSGTRSVPVQEGDVFTFRQYSIDTCCQPGHLTISGLSLWNGIVESTTTTSSTIPTTSTTTSTTTISETTTTTSTTTTTTSTTTTTTVPATTTTTTTISPDTTVSVTTTTDSPVTTTTTEIVIITPEAPTTTVEVINTPEAIPEAPAEVFPQPSPDVIPDPESIIDEIPSDTTSSIPEEISPNTSVPDTIPNIIVPDVTDLPQDAPISDVVMDQIIKNTFTSDISATEAAAALDNLLDTQITTKQLSAVVDAVFTQSANTEVMAAAVDSLLSADLSGEELAAVLTAVFDGDLSDSQTIDLAKEVLTSPLSNEEFNTVINAIFDEKVSDEVLVETFSAILDAPLTQEKFAEIVNVLESDTITKDQVSQVVDLIINQEGDIASDQATELATSPKVLESIDGSQATEVFAAVIVDEVSAEQGQKISEALINAPNEVKNAFQEEINIFAGVFDIYVPIDSGVNVGVRRTLVVAATALTTLTVSTGSTPPSPTNPGGNGGNGGPPPSPSGSSDNKKSSKIRRRKSFGRK